MMIGVIPCIQTFVLFDDDDDRPLVVIGIGSFVSDSDGFPTGLVIHKLPCSEHLRVFYMAW